MKIDFPPVRCFDEAAIFPGEEVLDAAVACFRMMLHLTAKFAHDVCLLAMRASLEFRSAPRSRIADMKVEIEAEARLRRG